MSERKTQFKSSWWIRRAAYLVIGMVGLIAAGFGLIDEGQLDALTASPLLASVVGFIAAAFTHEGSDSTVTADDVAKAANASAQVDVTRQVQSAIDAAISALPTADPGKIGQAVVAAIRAEENGEPTASHTDFVYGR